MLAAVRAGDRERLRFGMEKEPDTILGDAAVYRICERIFDEYGKRGYRRIRRILNSKKLLPMAAWALCSSFCWYEYDMRNSYVS